MCEMSIKWHKYSLDSGRSPAKATRRFKMFSSNQWNILAAEAFCWRWEQVTNPNPVMRTLSRSVLVKKAEHHHPHLRSRALGSDHRNRVVGQNQDRKERLHLGWPGDVFMSSWMSWRRLLLPPPDSAPNKQKKREGVHNICKYQWTVRTVYSLSTPGFLWSGQA